MISKLAAASSGSNHVSSDEISGDAEIKPTWTYVPYDPKQASKGGGTKSRQRQQQQFRQFSSNSKTRVNDDNWIVPKPHEISIPEDQLEMSFVRSSGAGGQNVNKVNTKVDVRFHVDSATSWIPHEEVRQRLKSQQSNRMNKDGYLQWSSQEYRTQLQNKKAAITKLQGWIALAYVRPKVRKQRTGISKQAKERNKEFKRRRSSVKEGRKKVKDW